MTNRIIETLGIDLFPYAIGTVEFKSDAPFEPTKLGDIQNQVKDLDAKKLDDALVYSKGLLDDESSRGEKLESKAYNLIGVTGISAAFITGISSLIPSELQPFHPMLLGTLLFIYILIVISLTVTVLLASRVVIVGNYRYSFPDIADVFKMNGQSAIEIKKDRLTTYIYCYAKNNQIHNIKASYLIGSQLWFRNSVVLFLLLAFTFIPNIFYSTGIYLSQSSAVLSLTPTTAMLTETQTVVPATPTIPVSLTPSGTIQPTVQPQPHQITMSPSRAIPTETLFVSVTPTP